MAHIAKGTDNTQRDLPKSGLHKAICVDVYDAGPNETPWGQKPKTMIVWELGQKHPEYEGPFRINRKYTTSLHEKSNMSKDLESWRGRAFPQRVRLEGFDVEKLIGVGCLINVIHHENEQTGIVYANVAAIMPLDRDDWSEPSGHYTRKVDRDAAREHDQQHKDEAKQRYGPRDSAQPIEQHHLQPTPPVEAYESEQADFARDDEFLPF